MSLQEVRVTIDADGGVVVKVLGVKGDACLDLTKKMEQYLGARIVAREHTDEFRQGVGRQTDAESEQDVGG